MELTEGVVLKGKYEITKKIGKGSLKETIYHGRHLELETDITIRVLPSTANAEDEVTKRFFQGIKLVANLQHPNIVAVLDAGEEHGHIFFVTNYHKGYYLNEYLDQRGQLDEAEGIRLIKALADALEYAWDEQNIVHRNICPNTILIAKGNIPMLTDFGLAKSLQSDSNLTLQGYTVGDPEYMSPEQTKGEQVDFRSDIYCLGLVLYQLFAGHPPFKSKNIMDVMQMQIGEAHKPIQTSNELISDACSAIIDKMLEKNVDDRYQSWEAVVNDFDAILNSRIPSVLNKEKKKIKQKVKRETEEKMSKKYRNEMEKVKMALERDAKSKLKRNIVIITVLINLVIFGYFVYYMMNKKEKSNSNTPQIPPVNTIINNYFIK